MHNASWTLVKIRNLQNGVKFGQQHDEAFLDHSGAIRAGLRETEDEVTGVKYFVKAEVEVPGTFSSTSRSARSLSRSTRAVPCRGSIHRAP